VATADTDRRDPVVQAIEKILDRIDTRLDRIEELMEASRNGEDGGDA
jgi:hypothetical protein